MASERRRKNPQAALGPGDSAFDFDFFFIFSRRSLAKWFLRAVPLTTTPGPRERCPRGCAGRAAGGGKGSSPQRAGSHKPGRNYKANKGELLDRPRP